MHFSRLDIPIKLLVKPVVLDELIVVSSFDNVATIKDVYLIGLFYGAKPMRNYKRCAAFKKVTQGFV